MIPMKRAASQQAATSAANDDDDLYSDSADAASTLDDDDDDEATEALEDDNQSSLPSSKEKPEIIATVLGDNDVVCAEGQSAKHHRGNVKFRAMLKEAVASFEKAEPRSNERRQIISDIVDQVYDQKGRFLSPIGARSVQAKEWWLYSPELAYQRTMRAMNQYLRQTKSAGTSTRLARGNTVSPSSGAASLAVGTGSGQPKRRRRENQFAKPNEKLLVSTADASNASATAEAASPETSTRAAVDQTLHTNGKENGNGGLDHDATESFKSAECATAATCSPTTLPDRACNLTMPPGSNANGSVSARAAATAAATASTTTSATSTTTPATTATATASTLGSGLTVAAIAATTQGLETPDVPPVGSTLKLPPNGSTRSKLGMTLGATSKAAPKENIPVLPGVMHAESIASDKLVHALKSRLPVTVERASYAAATAAVAAKKPTPTAAANESSPPPQSGTLATGRDAASKGVTESSGTTVQPSVNSTIASTVAAATTTAASLPVATLPDDTQSSVGKAAAAAAAAGGMASATPTTLTGATSLDSLPSLDECVELMAQEARQVANTNTRLISNHASRYEQVRALSADPLVQLGTPDSVKPMEAIPQPSSYAPNEWLDWFTKLDQQNKQLSASEKDLDGCLRKLTEYYQYKKAAEAKRAELAQQLNFQCLEIEQKAVATSIASATNESEAPDPGLPSVSPTVAAPGSDGATARYSVDECVEWAKKEAVLIVKNNDRLTKRHCALRDAINGHLKAMGESETLESIKPRSPNDSWLSWFVKLDRFNGELEQTIPDDEIKLEQCEQAAQMDNDAVELEKQAAEMEKQAAEARVTVEALVARKKATLAAVLGQPSETESPDVFDV